MSSNAAKDAGGLLASVTIPGVIEEVREVGREGIEGVDAGTADRALGEGLGGLKSKEDVGVTDAVAVALKDGSNPKLDGPVVKPDLEAAACPGRLLTTFGWELCTGILADTWVLEL